MFPTRSCEKSHCLFTPLSDGSASVRHPSPPQQPLAHNVDTNQTERAREAGHGARPARHLSRRGRLGGGGGAGVRRGRACWVEGAGGAFISLPAEALITQAARSTHTPALHTPHRSATPSARKTEVGVKQKAALLFSGQVCLLRCTAAGIPTACQLFPRLVLPARAWYTPPLPSPSRCWSVIPPPLMPSALQSRPFPAPGAGI